MGSLEEEEKLLQMVEDFIESESSSSSSINTSQSSYSSSFTTQNHLPYAHSTSYFSLQKILGNKTEEEKRVFDRVAKHMRKKMDLEKTTSLKQWLVKCLELDGFQASLCQTSWVTTPGCPCGNYEYIEVMMEEEYGNGRRQRKHRLILDIDFKSQFEVARPTKSYTELSSKLPTIFVGNEEKLSSIISILCSAAEKSLRERGLHIPPWRRPTYMHSKWSLSNSSNNNSNNHKNNSSNINTTIYQNGNNNINDNVTPRLLEKWVPPAAGIMKARRRDMNGGSGLSNQFSNMSINCC